MRRKASWGIVLVGFCFLAARALSHGTDPPIETSLAQLPNNLAPAGSPAIVWLRTGARDDQRRSDLWRGAVGDPVVLRTDGATPAVDSDSFVPVRQFVLLLQEVYRSDNVPMSLPPHAGTLQPRRPDGTREDIVTTARRLRLSLFYVPSMRNGPPSATREDRGNAILSTLALDDLVAIELPLERQRRVALATSIRGRGSTGLPWSLRLVTAHFSNAVAHHLWVFSEGARARQARALGKVVGDTGTMILGGDFKTWFGFYDGAYRELAKLFPGTIIRDRRPTFWILRLDHFFSRLPEGWTGDFRRAEDRYGSDHFPLVAQVRTH